MSDVERHMVSTLQALREGSEVLLATMDVFLNEPVMDWISEGTQNRQKNTAKKGGEFPLLWSMGVTIANVVVTFAFLLLTLLLLLLLEFSGSECKRRKY